MKKVKLVFVFIISLVIISCNTGTKSTSENNLMPTTHKVEVLETIDVSAYTYLKVKENDKEYWIAVTKSDAKKGDIFYYDNSVEMRDFVSAELDRTFDVIYFVEELKSEPTKEMPTMGMGHGHEGSMQQIHAKHTTTEAVPEIDIEPIEGGITIAELFSNKEKYNGKEVLMKGKVVKVNAEIMDRNWVHIQDGTSADGKYDLTITTNDLVKVGDIATFKGVITLNKDFGAGYSYEVIMEKAKLQ